MEEEMTNLLIFGKTRVETVIYLVEKLLSLNVIITVSKKSLARGISNSYNHLKEKQML